MFARITKGFLKELSLPQSYSKGMDYYKSGRVSNVEYINGHIVANVQGEGFYTTTITDIEVNPQFHCNCLFSNWGICKHSVAVGLKIINDPSVVKIVKSKIKKENQKVNLDKIFKKSSTKQRDKFLKDLLKNSENLQKKFQTYFLGQTEVEKKTSVDEIRNEVRECLENINLVDHERFYDYRNPQRPNYYGYREEREMLYDGANEEIDRILKPFIERMIDFLKVDNIIEAFKLLLGIYEGISTIDEYKIEDPVDIFTDGITGELLYQFSTIMDEFIRNFKNVKKDETALQRMSEILFPRLTIYEKSSEPLSFTYEIMLFKSLLTEMIISKKIADYILKKLMKFRLLDERTDILQLKIAEVIKDDIFWLKAAKRTYKSNPVIAKKLLEFYKDHQDTSNFVKVANIVFKKDSDAFDEFLYKNFPFHQDQELYGKVLFNLAARTENLKYFKEYNKFFGQEKTQEFINKIKIKDNRKEFYIKLLVEVKNYSEILKFVKRNIDSWRFENYISPMLNIYPEECYRIITKKTDEFLEIKKTRSYYQVAVRWLELLLEIENADVRKRISNYFENMKIKYKTRMALIDELKKAEIIK